MTYRIFNFPLRVLGVVVGLGVSGVGWGQVTAVDDTDSTDTETVINVAAPGLLTNDAGTTLMVTEVGGTTSTRAAANVGNPIRGQVGGEFTINADGSYTFNPNGDFSLTSGSTSTAAHYQVTDSNGDTAMATLRMNVNGNADPNQRPTPVDDTATTDPSTPLTVSAANGLLANDTDPNTGDTVTTVTRVGNTESNLRASTVGVVTFGNLRGHFTVMADGSWTYNPANAFNSLAPGASRTDSIVYEVADNHGAKSSTAGTLRITVTAPAAPDPDPDPTTPLTFDSTQGNLTLTANETLTAMVLPAASGGTGTVTYALSNLETLVPGLAFAADSRTLSGTPTTAAGAVTLTYTATATAEGGATESVSLTFTVTVEAGAAPVNQAPVAVDDTGATDPDTRIDIAAPGVLDNDSDPNGDTFTVTALGNNAGDLNTGFLAGLFPPIFNATSGGQFTIRTTGAWSFNPAGDFSSLAVGMSATTSVVYQISDTNGETATATITVTVTNPPDTPPSFGTTTQDDLTFPSARTISPNVVLPEASGGNGNLSYAVTPDLAVAVPGLIFTPGARTLSGTPITNAAAVTLTYTASDSDTNMAASDTASLTFTVTVIDPLTGEISLSVTGSGGDRDMSTPGLQVDEGDTIVLTTRFHGKTGGVVQTQVDATGTARYQLHGEGASVPYDIEPISLQPSAFSSVSHGPGDAGETKVTNFPVRNDSLSENDETLILTLSGTPSTLGGATGAATWTFGTPAAVTVTIRANDDSQAYIADTAPTTVAAGGTLNVPVAIRGSARTGVSTVNFTFTGTATTADYSVTTGSDVTFNPATTPPSGSITFSTTQTSRNIPVVLTADADTADETLIVTLSGHAGMVASPASTTHDNTAHTVTITAAAAVAPTPVFTSQNIPENTFVAATGGTGADTGIANVILPTATVTGGESITYSLNPATAGGFALETIAGVPQYSGIPTAVGRFIFTMTATGDSGGSAALTFAISTVANSAPVLAPVADQTHEAGTEVDLTLPPASGGNGQNIYTLANIDAVVGLSFNPNTRALSGTPTTTGTHTVMYNVRDDDNERRAADTDSESFTITVTANPDAPVPMFDSAGTVPENTYVPGVAGMAPQTGIFNVRLPRATVTDGTGVTYSMDPMSAGGLGLEITMGTFGGITAGPVYSGIPTNDIGRHIFTYTATGGSGGVAALTFAISIVANSAPDLPTVDNLTYVVGESVNVTLPPATGGNIGTHIRGRLRNIYTLNLGTGSGQVNIPGLTWNAATRVLSGTPSAAGGPHTLNYGVSDDDNDRRASDVDSESFTVTVTAGGAGPTFGSQMVMDRTYVPGVTGMAPQTGIFNVILPTAIGGASPITYTLPTLPANGFGFAVNAGVPQFGGIPAAVARLTFTYVATDANSATDSLTFVVDTVPNLVPTAGTSPGNRNYEIGETVNLTLPPASGGNGELSYGLNLGVGMGLIDIPGLTWDANTRVVSGSPTTATAAPITLVYNAFDSDNDRRSADVGSFSFTVTVSPAAPDFGAGMVEDQNYIVGQAIDTLTLPVASGATSYTLTPSGALNGLVFDASNRQVTGSPAAAAANSLTYTATNATGNDTLTFSVTAAADTAPAFAGGASQGDLDLTVDEPIAAVVLPEASGGNGDVSYTLPNLATLVPGLAFDADTRTLSGTPTTVAGAVTLTYIASDADANTAAGDTATLEFEVTVGGGPDYGTVTLAASISGGDKDATTPGLQAEEGDTITLTATFHGRTTTTGLTRVLATVSGTATHVLSNDMMPSNPGEDGDLRSAAGGMVAAPHYARFVNNFGDGRESVDFVVTVIDDSRAEGDETIEYTLVTTDFVWLPAASGTTGPTAPLAIGTPGSVTITILESDQPEIATAAFTTALGGNVAAAYNVGATVDLTLPVATGGNAPLAYSIIPDVTIAVPGLTFATATRVLSGSPTTEAGVAMLTYRVTDADRNTADQTFSIKVNAVDNNVPTFGSMTQEDETYTVGVAVDLTLPEATGGDTGDGPLTYSMDVSAVPGLVFTPATRVLSGMPSAAGGPHSLTLIANDGDANMDASDTATLMFSVTVEAPADLMPSFGSTQRDLSFPANTAIGDVTLPAASGGDGTLVYSLTPAVPGSVAGLAFNAGSRVLSGTPTAVAGAVTLTYTATDTDGDAASLTFSVTVTAAGTAPAAKMPADLAPIFTGLGGLDLTRGSARVNRYTVALDAPPTGSVTITPTSSEGSVTIMPASHTFTAADWNEAKAFTVTAGADTVAASVDIAHRLTYEAPGGATMGIDLTEGDETVVVNNPDPDVTVSLSSLSSLRLSQGGNGSYEVVLNAVPTGGNVTITPSSGDTSVATVSPAMLVFTAANWETPQAVTVTGGVGGSATITNTLTQTAGGNYASMSITAGSVSVTVSESVVATEEDAVNRVILPEVTRAMSDRQMGAVARRVGQARSGDGGGGSSSAAVSASAWAAEAMRSGVDGGFSGKAMLGASDFVLPLGASGGVLGESAAMWGSGDFRQLGGESGKINWDGDWLSVNAGVDAHLRDGLLAGLMLSWNEADIGYTDTDLQERGDYDLDMVSLHPYIGKSTPDGRLDWWATLGYGTGDLSIRNKTNNTRASSDITLQMLGVGGNSRLLARGDSELRLKAEAFTTRTDVDGGKASDLRRLSSLDVDARRVRLALQARRPHTLPSGANLTLEVEGGMRYDGGDGETGSGVEFGSALRYTDAARGLTWGIHTRALLYHAGDYEDFGIGGDVRLNAGADGQGLSLSLAPAYGNTAGGAEEVWRGGLAAVADADLQASLNTRVGYGLPSAAFMLTPYGEMALGEEVQNYRLGLSWGVGTLFDLNLVGERAEKDGVGVEHAIRFEGRVRF